MDDVLLMAVFLAMAGLGWRIQRDTTRENDFNMRLLNQCLADHHKEYECAAMLHRNSTTYIPIIVPNFH